MSAVTDAIEARDPHMAAKAMLRAVDGGLSHAKKRKRQGPGGRQVLSPFSALAFARIPPTIGSK